MDVDRTFSQWTVGAPRVKWSAVFAGWTVGLAIQMILSISGLGFGAWAIDLRDANPAEAVPIGAGVWTGLSMLLSAFVGGYITARLSGSTDRSDGLYHGILVWGVSWLVFAWLTTTAMATMIGGAFSLFGATLPLLGQGVSRVASTAVSRAGGDVDLSMNDLRKEVESVLPLARVSEQSLAELREALTAFDRDAAIMIMVDNWGMSETQARAVVHSTIGMLGPIRRTVRDVAPSSAAVGAQTWQRLGAIALWLSVLALITLAVSAIGGILGTPEEIALEATVKTESFRTDIRRAS
jgi:hypothetical protein